MTKIFAPKPRVVEVSDEDSKLMRDSRLGITPEQADACAIARAAGRRVHTLCGPGTDAIRSLLHAIPLEMQRKYAREILSGQRDCLSAVGSSTDRGSYVDR